MIAAWAKEEAALADFGDERLDDRLAILLSDLGSRPFLSIPAACGGLAEMKAAYRFFDNDKATFEKVIEPHLQRTKERMAAEQVVLLVQDTTEIDLTRPEQEVEEAANWMESGAAFCCMRSRPSRPRGRRWERCGRVRSQKGVTPKVSVG